MSQPWISGNTFALLENGEQFYPRVFETIASAQREVLLETFILYEDKVGKALHAALLEAARRGVQVDVTVDAFGSPDLSKDFVASLTDAGVRLHVFDPAPRLFARVNYFRRMHRKLVVVDGKRAFVGGINYSADHLADYGPEAKQDYAVEAEGPIVAHIRSFMLAAIAEGRGRRRWFTWRRSHPAAKTLPPAGNADALFVWRDNRDHKNDIERQYRLAIRLARKRVVIANAYFFPGYAFLRDLRKAARRGVEVSLILQGNPDMPIVQTAAAMLYHHLLHGGVQIYEYCERPLHGKVAVVDDEWVTVGSSNLDPLSLSLNLESNLMIMDRDFARTVAGALERLMRHSCTRVQAADLHEPPLWRKLRSFVLFHLLRRYPYWAGRLPAHAPRLAPHPDSGAAAEKQAFP
ncbi:cardiolipin synthase ClsB [Noviherbaspirillum denitrificans]|uniref:Cardiolipin synthase B n=1 Tax=Noviherbaspirillum denitrificans TaxID=1968433 RepID=A0A254TGJ8_9BURK|nr:cardiolipin synthase ClsB [Noviherbaspirillum denitrificans]OWW21655.1 cardiolipin synthase B [Noviherbaspirillum denitrificans]